MEIEIRRTETPCEEERRQLIGWGEDVFGVEPLGLEWRPKQTHFTLYQEGKPVSHSAVLTHTVEAGGVEVLVGGIGGVLTLPECQGRGLARRLLEESIGFLRAIPGVEFGFLFCLPSLVGFYASMGWQELTAPAIIQQPSGEREAPLPAMVLPLGERPWPGGEVRLGSFPW